MQNCRLGNRPSCFRQSDSPIPTLRTGLDRQTKACWRFPGSRACCFSACAGSQPTQDPTATRDCAAAVLPSSYSEWSRHPNLRAFRSSIAPPTDASVYASRNTSRCPQQDSRPGWVRYFLSCRALASPTTCRFSPAHSGLPVTRPESGQRDTFLQRKTYISDVLTTMKPAMLVLLRCLPTSHNIVRPSGVPRQQSRLPLRSVEHEKEH